MQIGRVSSSLADTPQRALLRRACRFASAAIGTFALTGCIIPGGGGIGQTVPDSVRAGEAAIVRLDMAVTDVAWIRGRYRDLTLHYRLVGDSAYWSVEPSRRIPVDRAHEAYELTIPPYPPATRGAIEFYVSVNFDGHPSQFEGYRKIRIVPADVHRGTADADTIVVSARSPAGWTFMPVGAGRVQVVDDVGAKAEGVRFVVDTSERSSAQIWTSRFSGMPLSALTALRFDTYARSPGGGIGAPFLVLRIDRDGDKRLDDELRFHPKPATGRWQSWDALAGKWERTIGRPEEMGEVVNLRAYAATWPKARLWSAVSIGGWKLGGTKPLDAVVDRVSIGVKGRTTTFVFRP